MPDFSFTEEQEMFRKSVRQFAQAELAPGVKDRAKNCVFPRELVKKMADIGLLGMTAPAEYGGQPTDWITVGIACEELGKVELGAGWHVLSVTCLPFSLMLGSEEIRQKYLKGMASGDILFCSGFTEPEHGSDALGMTARATRKGDHYLLRGEKTSISFGSQADVCIVFAKTDPNLSPKSITAFVMPLDLPGVSRYRIADAGFESIGRASIIMDDVPVPVGNRLGEEGKGFWQVIDVFDISRATNALISLGVAQAALAETINYAKQRVVFGRPIAKFEAVAFKIAEMSALIESARWLCYQTLWLRDKNLPLAKEAAQCKWWANEVAFKVCHEALLLHGHVGYSKEYPIEQRLRDVIGLSIGDGTPDILKYIISREILGREFKPF